MAAFVLFFLQNYLNSRGVLSRFIPGTGAERVVYNLIFAVFMYGSFAYQASRLSFFWNLRQRTRAAEDSYARFVGAGPAAAPPVEVLVPSYKEECHVVWQTLMSAALLDYPNRGVVLLLDNPPFPADPAERDLLMSTRAQVEIIAALLTPVSERFGRAAKKFRETAPEAVDAGATTAEAAALYDEAADVLERLAAQVAEGVFGGPDSHTRKFFIERILLAPAAAHRDKARQLRLAPQTLAALAAEFDRLSHLFRVRLSVFERKRYANLSHAPTKAANLNAYISIMGRSLRTAWGAKGLELVERSPGDEVRHGGEVIDPPDAKYLIILDADSFVLQDYATCMVSALESPQHARAAVMQTPYTAIPGCPQVLERTAGATTDIYYYVTEGMGFADAGFWVGASATIRKAALLDIVSHHEERGYVFPVYIQDKTVIEDTGATIDLVRRGWGVQNYPARLSYSATPSDFGALVVQRRRWANGGLILLGSLYRHLMRRPFTWAGLLEAVLRTHYLIMPACISVCMLLMLVYPFDFKRVSSWIYFTLPPYLYLVCRDLGQTGYRRRDIFQAYALFLLLLPVVLAGVKNSLYQMACGVKAEFGRTPKIERRTAIPLTCTAAILALLGWSTFISYVDLARGNQLHAVFALTNAIALGYGVFVMIGIGAIAEDFAAAISAAAAALQGKLAGAFGGRKAPQLPVVIAPLPLPLSPPLREGTLALLPAPAERPPARPPAEGGHAELLAFAPSVIPAGALERPTVASAVRLDNAAVEPLQASSKGASFHVQA